MPSPPASRQSPLAHIQLWLCPLDTVLPEPTKSLLHWLEPRERERYHRFGDATAAHRFLLGRLVLRSALIQRTDIPPADLRIDYSANGKPFLPDIRDIHFSISHTVDAVAVALAPLPIGLDLESTERRSRPWQRPQAFLHPREAERVAAMPAELERRLWFARCWTSQEAAIKLLDGALFDRARRIQLDPDGACGRYGEHSLRLASWYPSFNEGAARPAEPHPKCLPSHLLTLAAHEPLFPVAFRRWSGGRLSRAR